MDFFWFLEFFHLEFSLGFCMSGFLFSEVMD
jgi:hypothetical protein